MSDVSWGSIPEGFTATSCKVCGEGRLNPAYAAASGAIDKAMFNFDSKSSHASVETGGRSRT